MYSPIVKQTVPLTEADWVPVIAPQDTNSVAIRNLTDRDIDLRVDKDDDSTADIIGGHAQESYMGPTAGGSVRRMRFSKTQVIVWLRSASGSGDTAVRITMVT